MQSTGNQVIYSCKTFLAKSGEHYLRGARSLGRLSGIVRLSVLRSLVLKGSVAEGLLSPGMSGRVTQHSNVGDRVTGWLLTCHGSRSLCSCLKLSIVGAQSPQRSELPTCC